jgi:hypothetical protein
VRFKLDEHLYGACRRERRTLVTLDLDFSNPLRFPPGVTKGIVVVRPPRNLLSMIRATLASALPDLKSRSLKGRLWIVRLAFAIRCRFHVATM